MELISDCAAGLRVFGHKWMIKIYSIRHLSIQCLVFSHFVEAKTGEQASPIGIHDLWHAVLLNRFMYRFDKEIRMHGVREPEGQDPFAMTVNDSRQIQKVSIHRQIRDIHCLNLVGSFNGQVSE